MARHKVRRIMLSADEVRAVVGMDEVVLYRPIKPPPVLEQTISGPMWSHPKLVGQFAEHVFGGCLEQLLPCPFGAAGDTLWVQEAYAIDESGRLTTYMADKNAIGHWLRKGRIRPAQTMARLRSRVMLRLQNVSVVQRSEVESDGPWAWTLRVSYR